MLNDKCGVSQSIININGDLIIHGMRSHPENGTSGWYLWSGDYSDDQDFFKLLHGSHLVDRISALDELLQLPPGFRFIYDTSNGYIDIWEDGRLLKDPLVTK